MKNKTVIFVGIALALGLVGAYFAAQLGARTGPEMIAVPVAGEDIRNMTKLVEPEKKFQIKQFPKESLPSLDGPNGVVLDLREMKDQFLTKQKSAGSFVLRKELARTGVIELDEGKLAYAIAVNAESGTGLVGPGSRVNVTWTGRPRGDLPPMSGFLLTNVTVVAVDAETQRADGQKFSNPNTVVLQVDPKEVTTLAKARDIGRFSVSLCNPMDVKGELAKVDPEVRRFIDAKSSDSGDRPKTETVSWLRAKETIPAGTQITGENAARFFSELPIAADQKPENAVLKLSEVEGKFVRMEVATGLPLVKELFTDKAPGSGSEDLGPPPTPSHIMTIMEGGKRPMIVVFRNGVISNPDEVKSPVVPAPAPAPTPMPGAKPEDATR